MKVMLAYAQLILWNNITNTMRNMFYFQSLTENRSGDWSFIIDCVHYEVSQKHKSNWLNNCIAI